MMWKNIIDSSCMDINGLSKQIHRHCRTLQMPTGTTWTKWAFPKNMPISKRIVTLPQDKITYIFFLIFICGNPCITGSHFQFIKLEMGESAIGWALIDGVIDTFIFAAISNPLVK